MPIENYPISRPSFFANIMFYNSYQLPWLNIRDYDTSWLPENRQERPTWRDLIREYFERIRSKGKGRKNPDDILRDKIEDLFSFRYYFDRSGPFGGTGLNDVDFPMITAVGSDEFDELIKQLESVYKYDYKKQQEKKLKPGWRDDLNKPEYARQLYNYVADPKTRALGLDWYHLPRSEPVEAVFNFELFSFAKQYHHSLPAYVRHNKLLQEYARLVFFHAICLLFGMWFNWLLFIEEWKNLKNLLPAIYRMHEESGEEFQQLNTSYWGWIKVTNDYPFIKKAHYWDMLVRRIIQKPEEHPTNIKERLHKLHEVLGKKYLKDTNFMLDAYDTRKLIYFWQGLGWQWDGASFGGAL